MQWRKVFDRNPLFQIFCDKTRARDYVKERVSGLLFPEFYWVGSDPDLLPFDELLQPYIVKPSHKSGHNWIVRQPKTADRKSIITTCRNWLIRPHGRRLAEWGYQNVPGKILVEEYLGIDSGTPPLLDYKLFVFSGKVAFVQVQSRATSGRREVFLDRNGHRMRVREANVHTSSANPMVLLPPSFVASPSFQEMVAIAERLGRDIDHIRVDLYELDGQLYFSELTPYDSSGHTYLFVEDAAFESNPPADLDEATGAEWILPTIPLWQKFYRGLFG